jgi:hypothetical protein
MFAGVRPLFLQLAARGVRFRRAASASGARVVSRRPRLRSRASCCTRALCTPPVMPTFSSRSCGSDGLDDSAVDVVATLGAGTGSAISASAGTPKEADRVLRARGLVIVSSPSKGSAPGTSSLVTRCCADPCEASLGRSRDRTSARTYNRAARSAPPLRTGWQRPGQGKGDGIAGSSRSYSRSTPGVALAAAVVAAGAVPLSAMAAVGSDDNRVRRTSGP